MTIFSKRHVYHFISLLFLIILVTACSSSRIIYSFTDKFIKDEINYFGLAWRFDRKNGKRFGYQAPSVYPTGVHAAPLANMQTETGDRSLVDPFEVSESELWDKWIGTKINANSYKEHKRHKERWSRAEKEKQFNERVYG